MQTNPNPSNCELGATNNQGGVHQVTAPPKTRSLTANDVTASTAAVAAAAAVADR